MKDVLIQLLGQYVPSLAPDGTPLNGCAGLDVAWIFGGLIILLFVYCLFRLLGEIFK